MIAWIILVKPNITSPPARSTVQRQLILLAIILAEIAQRKLLLTGIAGFHHSIPFSIDSTVSMLYYSVSVNN
jgi:hypothetical protein